jgi:uncharacterized integral membrane protein
MFFKTRSSPASSSASQTSPVSDAPGDSPHVRMATNGVETKAERFRRKALRGRLRGYAIAAVAVVVVLIALAASNTAPVKVNWLIGSARVSLVWLVLAAAVLGWVLGSIGGARLHWRTRAPRRPHGAKS